MFLSNPPTVLPVYARIIQMLLGVRYKRFGSGMGTQHSTIKLTQETASDQDDEIYERVSNAPIFPACSREYKSNQKKSGR